MLRKIGIGIVVIIFALFVWNTSLFIAPLADDSGHAFQENTLASIEAAFALGAAVVEVDIQQTTDGRFAVFHDRTIDCRTEGSGEVTDHDSLICKASTSLMATPR